MKKPALIMLAIAAPLLNACSGGPNEAAEYRHSIFHVIAWHFGTLGAMAKGEQPFDQAVFERKAGILENLSKLPWEGFQEGTAEGSDAKPAIWENRDDFDASLNVEIRRWGKSAVALLEVPGQLEGPDPDDGIVTDTAYEAGDPG